MGTERDRAEVEVDRHAQTAHGTMREREERVWLRMCSDVLVSDSKGFEVKSARITEELNSARETQNHVST